MKKIIGLVFVMLFAVVPVAHAGNILAGTVVYTKSGCDYYIVSDNTGYDLLEWYGGRTPITGDVLVGDIHSYGFKDVYVGSTASTITKGRAWVDDYLLSTDSVVSKFRDKCNLDTTSYSTTYSYPSYNTYTPSTYTPSYTYPTYAPSYYDTSLSNSNYYTNTYGNTVHSPAYSATVPSSASARCGDGTYSFSQSRSGTCSHHGGVASWY